MISTLPRDIYDNIFPFLGTIEELTILRHVNKEFKYIINKRHLTKLYIRDANYLEIEKEHKNIKKLIIYLDDKCIHNFENIITNFYNITYLDITNVNLRDINILSKLEYLEYLACSNYYDYYFQNNNIILPKTLSNLKILKCDYLNLFEIPLYPTLEELDCKGNYILSLPVFPNLKKLNCSFNEHIRLSSEYSNLEDLSCEYCELSTIPYYPKLKRLLCSRNRLISLPKYTELEHLDCSNNTIMSLPIYTKLEILIYYNTIILLNSSLYPKLKIIQSLDYDESDNYDEYESDY
jgi:hypothetical protein